MDMKNTQLYISFTNFTAGMKLAIHHPEKTIRPRNAPGTIFSAIIYSEGVCGFYGKRKNAKEQKRKISQA